MPVSIKNSVKKQKANKTDSSLNIFMSKAKTNPDERNVKSNNSLLMQQDYLRVRTNLEKTQNLLDSFEPTLSSQVISNAAAVAATRTTNAGGKRSQSRMFIDELMQPILK